MSNQRRYRRRRTSEPPAHLAAAAQHQHCPDCDSDVSLRRQQGEWVVDISHDDNCPQLAWRQQHGATHGLALVAEPGKTVDGNLIADIVAELGENPHVAAVRVARTSATSWQDEALSRLVDSGDDDDAA